MNEVRLEDILSGKVSLVISKDKNGNDIRVGDTVIDVCEGKSGSYYYLSHVQKRAYERCGVVETFERGKYTTTYKVGLSNFGIVNLEIVDRKWEGYNFLPLTNNSKLITNKFSTWNVLEKLI